MQPWACALCISGPKAFVFQQQVFTLTVLPLERKLKTAALQRFVKKKGFLNLISYAGMPYINHKCLKKQKHVWKIKHLEICNHM